MATKDISFKHPRLLNLFIPIFFSLIVLFPALSLAQAQKIFKDNSKAIVVVISYDDDGNPISQGSGFIVKPDGVVVTNYHVISNAKRVLIKVGNKGFSAVGLLFFDIENDLALIKVNAENLSSIKFGSIDETAIGSKVYVISSPEGLENTISEGILSGIRKFTAERKILQITAPISHGSSGGAVFNDKGEVVGVATSFIKDAQNINFALPVDVIINKISEKRITALKDAQLTDYNNTAEYWFALGYYYGESQNYEQAIAAYKQAVRLNPNSAVAYSNLGSNLGNAGNYRESIDAFKHAIRINKDYADAYYGLGLSYAMLKMHREAVDSFKQAIRITPDYFAAHYNLGFSYAELKMYINSIDAFKQAIRIAPDYFYAHYGLGVSYGMLKMHRDSIDAYKQAIRINPDHADSHHNLGVRYAELKMYTDAIGAFKQAIRLNPNFPDSYYNLAYCYLRLFKYKEAISEYQQSIQLKPDFANAYFNLGITYIASGDKGSALNVYKTLKGLDMNQANKLFDLIYK